MLIKCKCGNTLTKDLVKTKYKNAYELIDDDKYITDKYIVKQGTYHRWERKWLVEDYKNVYVVSEENLTGVVRCNEEKGCCGLDYYELKCNHCNTKIGYGHNDCWQDSAAYLFTVKTKVVNK